MAQARDPYVAARHQMDTDHIVAEGVSDERVIEAMRSVPRHLFVRPQLRHLAYYDQALDIGFKQTISPPFIVAYMTETLQPTPEDRVLEIGTGSGYQAAVLSGLVKDVYTIEIVEPLGKRTSALLDRLGYDNVHCRIGDGFQGWPEEAPFDKIIVTCSPEAVPLPLVQQLKEGGRMIIPLGERYQQVFHLLEKRDGKLEQTELIPTLFVPMTGKMEELRQVQPDPLRPRLVNGSFEVDDNEDGLADGWHYQRRSTLIAEGAPDGKQYICFENDQPGRSAHMLQGLALDGSHVSQLVVSWTIQSEAMRPSPTGDVPGMHLYFFDSRRLPIGRVTIGPWIVDQPAWQTSSRRVDVPPQTREAILQVGLNGGTGRLCLDAIQLLPATSK